MNTPNTRALKHAIRSKYAWPGGYPLFLITNDGGALCTACGRREYARIYASIRHNLNDGWNVRGAHVNWEDTNLPCDHCGKQIESAYGKEEDNA